MFAGGSAFRTRIEYFSDEYEYNSDKMKSTSIQSNRKHSEQSSSRSLSQSDESSPFNRRSSTRRSWLPRLSIGGSFPSTSADGSSTSSSLSISRATEIEELRNRFRSGLTDKTNGSSVLTSKLSELSEVVLSALNCITDLSDEDIVRMIQDSYGNVAGLIEAYNFRRKEEEEINSIDVEELYEEYLTKRLYSRLFNAHCMDEAIDLSLSDRIKSLRWITAGFLETRLDVNNTKVIPEIDAAIRLLLEQCNLRLLLQFCFKQLIKMDREKTPKDKLKCVVEASNHILLALSVTLNGELASADDFLPALIFTLIRSNPPRLHSNILYISHFSVPYNVSTGEYGYYFTSLLCAKEYIQNIKHEDFPHIPRSDFNAFTYSCSPGSLTASSLEGQMSSFRDDASKEPRRRDAMGNKDGEDDNDELRLPIEVALAEDVDDVFDDDDDVREQENEKSKDKSDDQKVAAVSKVSNYSTNDDQSSSTLSVVDALLFDMELKDKDSS